MCVEKQIPSLCQLHSFHEDLPQEFLDETDVDSSFDHNIFDNSKSQHPRDSNKNSFANKLFHFCNVKTQHCYIFQEDVNLSKRELGSLIDSLRDFLETIDKVSKCLQIPLPKFKI